MFLTPTELYVICEHDAEKRPVEEGVDYYDLFYRNDGKDVVVASSGWTQDGWESLPNHKIMKVDRSTLAIEVLPVTE